MSWVKFVCPNPECDEDTCATCCDHSDIEDFHCLICGEDRTEHLAAYAEYVFEGDR